MRDLGFQGKTTGWLTHKPAVEKTLRGKFTRACVQCTQESVTEGCAPQPRRHKGKGRRRNGRGCNMRKATAEVAGRAGCAGRATAAAQIGTTAWGYEGQGRVTCLGSRRGRAGILVCGRGRGGALPRRRSSMLLCTAAPEQHAGRAAVLCYTRRLLFGCGCSRGSLKRGPSAEAHQQHRLEGNFSRGAAGAASEWALSRSASAPPQRQPQSGSARWRGRPWRRRWWAGCRWRRRRAAPEQRPCRTRRRYSRCRC